MLTKFEPPKSLNCWLECRLDKGMFSDEVAVTYPAEGPWQKSVFVEKSFVKGCLGGLGKVRVIMVQNGESMIVTLPSPEQDIVYVNAGEISEE